MRGKGGNTVRPVLLKAAVFLAAFLLFQVELIISKAMLPGFGGSYLVWSTCVMFFQAALLLGYAYAHLAGRWMRLERFGVVQAALFFAPLLLFPISLREIQSPEYALPFVAEIVWLLLISIGPAFLVLATVSVTVQNALASTGLPEAEDPYFLYGTSNLGSFLALLTYPFLVEPFLNLNSQLLIWQGAYIILAMLGAAAMLSLVRSGPRVVEEKAPVDEKPGLPRREMAGWFLLSAAGSAMFLSVTNAITFDLAAIPLFWVLPLGIYLLTFVLNFKKRPWCPAWLKERFFLTVPVGVFVFFMMVQGYVVPVWIMMACHLAILFIFCMYCHSELYQSRPPADRGLTAFYLVIAAGGFAGSALVSWLAPLITTSMTEYLFGFLLVFLALSIRPATEVTPRYKYALAIMVAPLVILWPMAMGVFGSESSMMVTAAAGVPLALLYFFMSGSSRPVLVSLAVIVGLVPVMDYLRTDRSLVYRHRNYYGIYRVYDQDGKRLLRHGATLHGSQYLDPPRQDRALMYYHDTAPAGELLKSGLIPWTDMAIIGLGAGSLALYSRAGQKVDFYELDPDNLEVAEKYFTYLDLCEGEPGFVFGDARLMLRRAKDRRYDVIIVDAFNSDSIPVHLITTDAIREYETRLKPGGLILFHVSNRYLDLKPVLAADAKAVGMIGLYKTNQGFKHPDAEECEWAALTRDPEKAGLLASRLEWKDLSGDARPWTDRYSNLLGALLDKE